jgi:hypothetical protein
LFEMLRNGMAEVARKGHVRGLELSVAPSAWVEALTPLTWAVEVPVADLILPDCIAISLGADGLRPLAFGGTGNLRAVFMPISRDRLLVGRAGESTPLPSVEDLASCSWEFFLAHARIPSFDGLRGLIGSRIRPFVEALGQESTPCRPLATTEAGR